MYKFCDIHSHLLPGVDDGAKDMEETYRMLSIAYEEGIRTIVATPHFRNGGQNVSIEKLQELIKDVSKRSEEDYHEFRFLLGQELFYSPDLIHALKAGEAITMNATRYILVEFLPSYPFREIRNGIYQCLHAGYLPILAHTERYQELHGRSLRVRELIDLGAYIQINISSLIGSFSRRTTFCHKLIKGDLVHFLGTDCHGSEIRKPCIRQAVKILKKKYSEDTLQKLLWDNPTLMLENRIL